MQLREKERPLTTRKAARAAEGIGSGFSTIYYLHLSSLCKIDRSLDKHDGSVVTAMTSGHKKW
jgi:hypothetical protein